MNTTDPILTKLLDRRKKLQEAYDALVSEPASYSISGSVSATNQKLSELRGELARMDADIAAYLSGSNGVLKRSFPRYRGDSE